jgi:hypothetical protein
MRVVVLSDTHIPRGDRRLPDGCVELIREADAVVHAGDLTSTAFLQQLRSLGPAVHAVHGNMDEPALQQSLPETFEVELGGARIGVIHDPGPLQSREQRLAARFPGCAAVIYGHTHLPQAERHGGVWILNPGSPTERRRAPSHTVIVLDVGARGELEPALVEV